MASKFASEIAAIKYLRDKYKHRPAKSLADQIASVNFAEREDRILAREATGELTYNRPNGGWRTASSIYSVIRRYDAKGANIFAP